MKVATQRRIDQIVGSFLCRLFSLWPKRRPRLFQPVKPEKILVILLSEMGSLVLARPMFERIRKKYPAASVYVLVFERNREMINLLDIVSSANILTIRDHGILRMAVDSLRALRKLRSYPVDTVIDCELFSRISSIYAFLSGAAVISGFHPHTQEGLYRGGHMNRPVLYNPYIHIARQFIHLADALEATGRPLVKQTVSEPIPPPPRVKIGPEETAQMENRIRADFPALLLDRFILLYPGGGLLSMRAWPLSNYCRLAGHLNAAGYSIGVIGMQEDRKLARTIGEYCRFQQFADLTGYTESIRDLLVLFHLSRLLITNDGGPGHFSALTPMPVVILYGPETPVLYGPINENACTFYAHLSCSPCLTAYNHRNSPCDGDNVCLQSISVESVLKKIYEILGP